MSQGFRGWIEVSKNLNEFADGNAIELNDGQRDSLRALASRLQQNGVIIADEVGMGKTRIAAAAAKSVIAAGGRVAILLPPGLDDQWRKELRTAGIDAPSILRSLWQYLQAWESKTNQQPWFNEHVVLISHAFTNWRLGDNSDAWRWALLPELYARWNKLTKGRFPRDYHEHELLNDDWVKRAAESIAAFINATSEDHAARRLILELVENIPWPAALKAGQYTRNAQLRPLLEQAVGLGLGVFDLVIIDEAHKSRGQESGLNRLIKQVVLQSEAARLLAITATPVELNPEQWNQILDRIKVDTTSASTAIPGYIEAIKKIRECPNDLETREAFKNAAAKFKADLSPYLLRRDKREEQWVKKFQEYSSEGFHAYRHEKQILVDTASLSPAWKQAVCAAEALSFVARLKDDSVGKRLRLTLGNGHGLVALIDQLHSNDLDDKKQCEADGVGQVSGTSNSGEIAETDKRLQRAAWWKNVMKRSSQGAGSGYSALYDHPAILAAVDEIEKVSRRDEKILVFGRFTRPLRALVELLNAREMLRCIDSKQPWPQSKVALCKTVIAAAHRRLHRSGNLNLDDINTQLAQQYKELEQQRRKIRGELIENIRQGILENSCSNLVKTFFDCFDKDVSRTGDQNETDNQDALALVALAIKEQIEPKIESALPCDFAAAFTEIVDAINAMRDRGENDADSELAEPEAKELWHKLVLSLRDEYSQPEGGFARLMYGETKPTTRHFLKSAFNRKHGYPKVLVAQSVVGREGLNLHKACRTVVLLHPEWNPGVVEQQIGRVDRIGSLWESKLKDAIENNVAADAIPRIEIRPVIFQGTYDEKNWQVLRERWDELRAQLHGIVLTARVSANHVDSDLISEINALAPNFSPSINKVRP